MLTGKALPDPLFADIPWEIITNDRGEVIGEVYTILPDPPPRKRQNKRGVISTTLQGKR